MKSRSKSIKKKKGEKIRVGMFLVIIFLLLYVPSLYHWVSGKTIETGIIRMGNLEDSINTDGYLVRDEEVINSPIEGKCITCASEGEKVASNFTIATILKDSSEKLLEDLKQVDLKIIEAQNEKSKSQDVFSDDAIKLDNEIGQKVKLLINESNTNYLVNVGSLTDEIDGLVEKRATIIGSLSTPDVFLNTLKTEKTRLQDKLNQSKGNIMTNSPGIVSYTIDGYEGVLNPKALDSITPKLLESIKIKETMKNINNKKVEAQKPFAKIIKGVETYVVVAIDSKKVQALKDKKTVSIRLNDINRLIEGKIDYKSGENDGKYIVGIKIDRAVSETAGLRKINVDIIFNSYEGLKVPLGSLKNVDYQSMTASIVLVKANYATEKKVSILGKNEESAIIEEADKSDESGVSLYSIYVLHPQNVQEGQLIGQ